MARIVLIAALMMSSAALAQSAPAGWTLSGDTYTHTASGIVCPPSEAGYSFKSISGATDPNFDGVCTYDKGDGEIGLVRVRHYIEGVGETPLAIKNDYDLMHRDASGPQGEIVGAFRGGPGPIVDGVQTYQIVLTKAHHGYLLDCIARHSEKSAPANDFPFACEKLAN